MPIRNMRRFAELRRAGESTIPARQALLEEHRDEVLERIAELQRDLQALTDKINLYHTLKHERVQLDP